MGTSYTVQIVNDSPNLDFEKLADSIQARLDYLDKELMSTYSVNSELSKFNRSIPQQYFPVSKELAEVVAQALEIYELSNHLFDITIGPLIEAWGFGAGNNSLNQPSEEIIDAAKGKVGGHFLSVSLMDSTLYKSQQIELDLSGIGKGYAVDQIAALLNELNVESFLIEIGGELLAQGRKPNGSFWTLGIENPENNFNKAGITKQAFQTLSSQGDTIALAGSGDYRNYFEFEGQRYSHEINPLTGWPVKHNLLAVTVINQSASKADALATAFMVMGAEAGFELASSEQLAVYFIIRSEAGVSSRYTSTFAKYLQ